MKGVKILIVCLIVASIVLCCISIAMNGWRSFFKFNILDILTFSIISIVLYIISKIGERKDKKNSKIENTIVSVVAKLQEISLKAPSNENYAEYLYSFKYLSNKFDVLQALCDEIDKQYINEAKNNFEKMREFITDNINLGSSYFEDKDRKDKIPNLVANIETSLDKVIIRIYS